MLFLEFQKTSIFKESDIMRRKNIMIILFAVALMLLFPNIAAEAKMKPKLAAKKKLQQ